LNKYIRFIYILWNIKKWKVDSEHIIHKCTKFKILSIKNIFTQEKIDKIIYNERFINYRLSETQIQENDFIEINDIIYIKSNTEYEIFFLNENDAINFSFSFNRLVAKYKEYNISFSGPYKKYDHLTGKIYKDFYHNNGIFEGEYIDYQNNGCLQIKCNYINGKLHGKHIYYFENGIINTSYYTLGIKNGESIIEEYYDNNGINILLTREIINYDNGIIINPIIKYFYDNYKITSTKYIIKKDGGDYFSFKINHEKDENNKLYDEMKIIMDKLKI